MTHEGSAGPGLAEVPIAHQYFEHIGLEYRLDDALMTAFGADPEDTKTWPASDCGYDYYDSSFELWGTRDDFEPTDEHLDAVWALGFARGWICYRDGTEIAVCGYSRGTRKERDHGQPDDKRYIRQARRRETALLAEIERLHSALRAATAPQDGLRELESALMLQHSQAHSVVGMAGCDALHNERYLGKADGIAQALGSVRILLERAAAPQVAQEGQP